MSYQNTNGKKTAIINVFIDPENGFLNPSLNPSQGGSLYVPAGEEVAPLMGEIINNAKNGIFVIAQDYHPANHISFITSHKGVLEYRKKKFKNFLQEHNQSVPNDSEEFTLAAQQPVHFFNGFENPPVMFPFEEIVLDKDRNIIGLKEADGRIRNVAVETSTGLAPSQKDRGRVTQVLDSYFDKTFNEMRAAGEQISTQTLWTQHCIQGTESCQYPDAMNLPEGLKEKLKGDMMSRSIYHRDAVTGNQFHVIRKGNRPEVDSYGIGVENDGETMTPAWDVFRDIASKLKAEGVEQVVINVGGLASNFCVEFSANNIADFLAGHFKMRGMNTEINYVPEISRGIPIAGGPEVPFSEAGVAERLKASRGIDTASIIKPGKSTSGNLQVDGGPDKKQAVG